MASKRIKMCHFPVKSQYRYYIRVAGHMRGWLRLSDVFICLFNTFLETFTASIFWNYFKKTPLNRSNHVAIEKHVYLSLPLFSHLQWENILDNVYDPCFFVMIPLYLKSIITSITVVFIILKYCIVIIETRGEGDLWFRNSFLRFDYTSFYHHAWYLLCW